MFWILNFISSIRNHLSWGMITFKEVKKKDANNHKINIILVVLATQISLDLKISPKMIPVHQHIQKLQILMFRKLKWWNPGPKIIININIESCDKWWPLLLGLAENMVKVKKIINMFPDTNFSIYFFIIKRIYILRLVITTFLFNII